MLNYSWFIKYCFVILAGWKWCVNRVAGSSLRLIETVRDFLESFTLVSLALSFPKGILIINFYYFAFFSNFLAFKGFLKWMIDGTILWSERSILTSVLTLVILVGVGLEESLVLLLKFTIWEEFFEFLEEIVFSAFKIGFDAFWTFFCGVEVFKLLWLISEVTNCRNVGDFIITGVGLRSLNFR